MNNLSTKDLNKLRSQSKIITNRVEIFVETYLSESHDEKLIREALQEIINAANNLTTAASKMIKTPSNHT